MNRTYNTLTGYKEAVSVVLTIEGLMIWERPGMTVASLKYCPRTRLERHRRVVSIQMGIAGIRSRFEGDSFRIKHNSLGYLNGIRLDE